MKTITIKLLFGACFASLSPLSAQTVDRAKYPDYTDKRNPDYALMQRHTLGVRNTMSARPDHVNNAETRFFPPVFNQDGGSCGSASRIGYMFSYEMNAFRNLDGTNPQNYYPTHFVWLLTNGNSGKDAFVQHVGVPSAETYGGQTYSKLFGNQEETQNDFGWMTGYDKWYEAMFNRMLKPANFPENTGTDAGREALKNWLWNHNGDESFQSGGLAGVGVAAGTMTCKAIDSTPTNDKLGVTGMKCVDKWGTGVDHALTIVGYDDRIEFDINGNGIYGEEAADERGAWILVNSWGNEWQMVASSIVLTLMAGHILIRTARSQTIGGIPKYTRYAKIISPNVPLNLKWTIPAVPNYILWLAYLQTSKPQILTKRRLLTTLSMQVMAIMVTLCQLPKSRCWDDGLMANCTPSPWSLATTSQI